MRKHYTEKELRGALRQLCVLCDTREQSNGHILGYFQEKGVPYKLQKLDQGDYSFCLGDISFADEIAIEKKHGADEIAGNFTADRPRFENEFMRYKARGIKPFLLIEDCSWADIKAHNYRSKLSPKALMASLLAWQVRYNITVVFCRPEEAGELIYATFYYWLKDRLENGGCIYGGRMD